MNRRDLIRATAALLGIWAMSAASVSPAPAAAGATVPSEAELLRAYLPKDDLGVTRFLADHPEADGRGVLVAVLDTGIDLHHPGLLHTPSGERKIVDVYDATDNGLLDLPVLVTTRDTVLTGWTGRTLRLGPHRAADGVYRLGRLSALEVFPRGLTARLQEIRAEERRREIDAWEARVEAPPRQRDSADEADTVRIPADRAEAYREARRTADREFSDLGPVYDLVAWRSAGAWRLVIDTDADGDLSEETELRPYRERGDLALFPAPVEFSVALASIKDDGSRIVLMFDEGGHGTHVAGIIGAYYGPDDPLNGLAPGVRFLSVKIGNGRLGGGTSHNAIAKGISWAVARGAMVANISFGGTSHFDDGREVLARYLDTVVQNHGILVTMSAGNEGPGLSTVGAAGTARRTFTLGAAISPLTMMTSYSGLVSTVSAAPRSDARGSRGSADRDPAHGIRMFNFSSRGPLANGSPGIDLIAPGAAVSPLPTWLVTRNENWNGTSMAAPQAAGCLALLTCAARQEKIPISPARVDRSLRASAIPLAAAPPADEISFVEQGAGLIHLPGAYAALRALAAAFPVTPPALSDSCVVPEVGVPATRDPLTGWRVSVYNPTGEGEGIYDRNETATKPYWRTIRITPDLPERGAEPLRARFLRLVRLESTVAWMEAPPQTSVPASGTSLRVRIDPSRLRPGLNVGLLKVHTVAAAEPGGATVSRRDAPGTEVDIPVVLVRPEHVAPADLRIRRTFDLLPGERQATFVVVPEGATRMSIRLKELSADPANTYSVAATAVDLRFPPPALRGNTGLSLRRDDERTLFQRVEGGSVVELALFARWVNAGPGSLEASIGFDGLEGPGGYGSTATLGGESSPEARWGEPPVQILPERDGASVPLRAPLADTRVDVDVRIDGRVEPLALTWSVKPDTVHTISLEGPRDALLALGRGLVRLDREETVTCDLRQAPELEDFLDDCFFRLFAPTGQMVDAGNISSGPFRLRAPGDGPASGWYRIEISIFGCGRDFLRDTAFFSPEIVRSGSFGRVTPFPDPVAGRIAGADSSWSFDFPRGWTRSLYLRTRGLPDDGVFAGSLRLRDRSEAPPLLSLPLRADTRVPRAEAEPPVQEALDRLEEAARRLLSDPPSLLAHETPDREQPSADGPAGIAGSGSGADGGGDAGLAALTAALGPLDRADALQKAWDPDQAEATGRWWNRMFLRCDLHLRFAPDDPAAREAVGKLLDASERRLSKDLPEESDRRRAGRIALRRAALAVAGGDLREARRQLDRSEKFAFGGDPPEAVRATLLLAEHKPLEAIGPLGAAAASDPWNPRLARLGIRLLLDQGWTDLADEALAWWPERFPREKTAFFDLVRRRAITVPAEESRARR